MNRVPHAGQTSYASDLGVVDDQLWGDDLVGDCCRLTGAFLVMGCS